MLSRTRTFEVHCSQGQNRKFRRWRRHPRRSASHSPYIEIVEDRKLLSTLQVTLRDLNAPAAESGSFNNALALANAGDTISIQTVLSGVGGTVPVVTVPDLTIEGNNYQVSCWEREFLVNQASTTVIDHMRMTIGAPTGQPSIDNQGGNLVLSSCIDMGHGISTEGGGTTTINGQTTLNQVGGVPLVVNGGTVLVTASSTIHGTSGVVVSNGGSFTLDHSTESLTSGDGVDVYGLSSTAVVDGAALTTGSGTGILNQGGPLLVWNGALVSTAAGGNGITSYSSSVELNFAEVDAPLGYSGVNCTLAQNSTFKAYTTTINQGQGGSNSSPFALNVQGTYAQNSNENVYLTSDTVKGYPNAANIVGVDNVTIYFPHFTGNIYIVALGTVSWNSLGGPLTNLIDEAIAGLAGTDFVHHGADHLAI